MTVILLADGFEEIEALTPLDMLRRAGVEVRSASVSDSTLVTGAHGITVVADMLAGEVNESQVDMLILPGGMPGTLGLDASADADRLIRALEQRNARIAAICAAPLVLGRRGLLRGKRAVCYPGFEQELLGAVICESGVVTDGNITTAKGMGVALEFAKELVALQCSREAAVRLSREIQENQN